MFKIIESQGRSQVQLQCDACGQYIESAGGAAVLWPRSTEDGAMLDPVFVHKGRCHETVEDRLARTGGHPPWMELQHFMVYALHNLGLRGEALDFAFESAGDLGFVPRG